MTRERRERRGKRGQERWEVRKEEIRETRGEKKGGGKRQRVKQSRVEQSRVELVTSVTVDLLTVHVPHNILDAVVPGVSHFAETENKIFPISNTDKNMRTWKNKIKALNII